MKGSIKSMEQAIEAGAPYSEYKCWTIVTMGKMLENHNQLDGMPVNMVSHAHGQGYADFHFVMPEVVDKIHFEKGPYDVTKGNLATAGAVDFQTREQLSKSFVSGEYGMFDHKKITAGIKVLANQRNNAYFAADYYQTDNYFESPQDFKRINFYGKYTGIISPNFKVTVSASTFQSSWNASGQIPERAVSSGTISRFGAIDNTEGGKLPGPTFNSELFKRSILPLL